MLSPIQFVIITLNKSHKVYIIEQVLMTVFENEFCFKKFKSNSTPKEIECMKHLKDLT